MTIASDKLNQIKSEKWKSVIRALKVASMLSTKDEEFTCNMSNETTFSFTYQDSSVLKIRASGLVFLSNGDDMPIPKEPDSYDIHG